MTSATPVHAVELLAACQLPRQHLSFAGLKRTPRAASTMNLLLQVAHVYFIMRAIDIGYRHSCSRDNARHGKHTPHDVCFYSCSPVWQRGSRRQHPGRPGGVAKPGGGRSSSPLSCPTTITPAWSPPAKRLSSEPGQGGPPHRPSPQHALPCLRREPGHCGHLLCHSTQHALRCLTGTRLLVN